MTGNPCNVTVVRNGHLFASNPSVTSFPNALASLGGPVLPPSGSSGLRGGPAGVMNPPAGIDPLSSSRSFAQILSDLNAQQADRTSDSGVAGRVPGTWMPSGQAQSPAAPSNKDAGPVAVFLPSSSSVASSKNALEAALSTPDLAAPAPSTKLAPNKSAVSGPSAKAGNRTRAAIALSPPKGMLPADLSLDHASTNLAVAGPLNGSGFAATVVVDSPALSKKPIPSSVIAGGAKAGASTRAADLGAPLSAPSGQTSTGLMGTANSKGFDNYAASFAGAPILAVNRDSITPRAASNGSQQAKPIADNDSSTGSSTLPAQTDTNGSTTVLPNSVASPQSLLTGVTSRDYSPATVYQADRLLVAPHDPAALPAGDLAFALRLTTSDASAKARAGDSQSLAPQPAVAGSRLLDAIFNGSNAVLRTPSIDAPNRAMAKAWEPDTSSRSFASQLKALTGGLPGGRQTFPPSSESGQSSPSVQDESSAGPRTADSGLNPGLSNAVSNELASDGLIRVGAGRSAPPPATGTRGVRADGIADANQIPVVQAQFPANPAESSTKAGAVAADAAPNLPEKDVTFGADPVRNIRVQVAGEGNQRVDMHLVERGGTLSVSVRSSDETLSRSLQDNLPELNTRLTAQHFQTEAWMPARGAASGFGSNDSGSSAGSDRGPGSNDSGGRQGGGASADDRSGYQRHAGQPQDERPDSRPNWVRQLAALNALSPTASGNRLQIGKEQF